MNKPNYVQPLHITFLCRHRSQIRSMSVRIGSHVPQLALTVLSRNNQPSHQKSLIYMPMLRRYVLYICEKRINIQAHVLLWIKCLFKEKKNLVLNCPIIVILCSFINRLAWDIDWKTKVCG